jgi:hypothetical protein
MKLPLTSETFSRGFLAGKGALTVGMAGASALSETAPFPDGTRALVVAKAGGTSPNLKFGTDEVKCQASFQGDASVTLTICQPGDPTPIHVGSKAEPVPAGQIGALFQINAEGSAKAGASVPGPAGFSFGLSAAAGGGVSLARYRLYERNRPARAVLLDTVADLRLPAARGTLATLPDAGEIVQFSYNGFVELGAALNWGYALNGSEGFQVKDIQASIEYAFKAKASVSVNYRLAGEFAVSVLAGTTPGFARVVLHKRRDAKFSAAAGFQFDGRGQLKGLPETPNEFLGAFLGTDVQSALQLFDKTVQLTDLAQLEKLTGTLFSGVVEDLSAKWLGALLEQANVKTFLSELNKAVKAYKSIDERIIGTVTGLYERLLGPEKDTLERVLHVIKGLNNREELAKVVDPKAVEVIQLLTGGDIFALMFGDSNAKFAELHHTVSTVLDMVVSPDFDRLRDVIDAVKERLKLDVLFGRLEKISTPAKLKGLTDKTLEGLVERIVGRTFDEIRKSAAGEAFKDLHDTLTKLQKFKTTFNERIQGAFDQSVSMRINFLYARATSDRALLDVEIDVRTPAGEALFQDAVAGRMRELFVRAQGEIVRVNDALLTHEVTRSSQLQINVLGWEHKRLVEVVGKVEHSLQSHDGGLVQVFTTETSLKELSESGRKSSREKMQTNMVLRMAGETFGEPSDAKTQRFVIKTLERLSCKYEFLQEDELTDIKELSEYLALGQQLKLVPDSLLADLEEQFGSKLGKVTAKYVVRFDHKAIHDAFTAVQPGEVIQIARKVARRLVAAQFATGREKLTKAAIGLAYASDSVASTFYDVGQTALEKASIKVRVPASITGGATMLDTIGPLGTDFRKSILTTLFLIERSLSDRLGKLDQTIDDARLKQKPVSPEDLVDAAKDVAAAAADMDQFNGPNSFFAIIDTLIARGGAGKAHRESALVLTITPPGGQPVTKMFMEGATN